MQLSSWVRLMFLLAASNAPVHSPAAQPDETYTIVGEARVKDADTIEIAGQPIRLEGVDAPEMHQVCPGGSPDLLWCGTVAASRLRARLAGEIIRCTPQGHDRYGRTLATFYVGSDNVEAWLVTQGLAMAFRRYSVRYLPEEEAARAAGAGFWSTDFEPPWTWRARQREVRPGW